MNISFIQTFSLFFRHRDLCEKTVWTESSQPIPMHFNLNRSQGPKINRHIEVITQSVDYYFSKSTYTSREHTLAYIFHSNASASPDYR